MQTFDDFYKQEILDEADIKAAIMDKAKTMSANIVMKAKKVFAGLDFERKETMFMLETFFKKLKEMLKTEKTITDDDVKRALKQLGDVGKFALIAPLFLLPGGGTTTAVLYMAGKKLFNISILPQGLEQVFETMSNLKESLAQMTQLNEGVMKEFSEWVDNKIQEKMEISKQVSGSYSGQTNFSLYIKNEETVVGKLDAVDFEDVPSISMIEVYEPRMGYGKKLVQHLQSLYPEVEIEWGVTTKTGEKLRKSLSYKKVKTPYHDDIVELENLEKRLKDTREKTDLFYKIKKPSDVQKKNFLELVKPMDDMNDRLYELEQELMNKTKFYHIVKT